MPYGQTITVRLSKELAAWLDRYADRRPDLAGLCLVRMSELRKDFRVYRRNKREAIALVYPPGT